MADRQLHSVWAHMVARCADPTNPRYGGRGIKVCEGWLSARAFKEWALANGYEPGLSLDRVDVDGNYEPGNCRWATFIEQARNRRNNTVLTLWGESKCIAEWAEDERCPHRSQRLIGSRLKGGWTPEQAVGLPLGSRVSGFVGQPPRQERRTHCPQGHALTPENTGINRKPGGRWTQRCLTCHREREGARHRARHRRERGHDLVPERTAGGRARCLVCTGSA